MEPLRIRYNLWMLLYRIFIYLLVVGFTLYGFNRTRNDENLTWAVMLCLTMAGLIGLFSEFKRIAEKKAVIILTSEAIKIENTVYPWKEIISWKVYSDSENGYYLFVKTNSDSKEIRINRLDMSSKDIRAVIETYIHIYGNS